MPAETTSPEPEFFQSVDEWMNTAEFRQMMQDEFPEDAEAWLDPVSRRRFFQLAGASAALAGAVGCNYSLKPMSQHKVVPYVEQPVEILPGVPLFFATAMEQAGGVGLGLIAKSSEGRPLKVEGNPNCPSSVGGTNLFAQASLLGMYDPERSRSATFGNAAVSYDKAISAFKDEVNKQRDKGGAGIRILSTPTTSPTLIGLIEEFLKRNPQAKWVQYEPTGSYSAKMGARQAFGKFVNPVYKLANADVVLALDSDFLDAAHPAAVVGSRDFMARRKVRTVQASLDAKDGFPAPQNRLYSVESNFTCTGGTADHRLPLKPTEIEAFARAVAKELGIAGIAEGKLPDIAKPWIKPIVDDLKAKPGRSLVLVGESQPPAVHRIAHAINQKLGAVGSTVVFTDPLQPRAADSYAELKTLAEELKTGKADLLLILQVNPAYDAPADLEFASVLKDSKATKFHFGLYDWKGSETAAACQYHIPSTHYLESWGDLRAHDGTVLIQQPLIAPLFAGHSALELFSSIMDLTSTDKLDYVKNTWQKHFDEKVKSGDFGAWWHKVVRDGVVPGTALPATNVPAADLAGLDQAPSAPAEGMQIQFFPDPTIYDGRFANNGWLQELPKQVTCLTWDNAAIVSPKTAAKLGVSLDPRWTAGERGRLEADIVELKVGGRSVQAGVFIVPGHADDAITVHLGYGRSAVGTTGKETGFNGYVLRTSTTLGIATGATATKTGAKMFLACVQGQYSMEGRRPYRSASIQYFSKPENKDFAQVPAASAGEYKEIRALTPGTFEDYERLHNGKHHPLDHSHPDHTNGDEHKVEHESHHDKRIIPLSLYPKYPQTVDGQQASVSYRRWGMAVDLGACTGCGTCVAACVAENNIPVIGKYEVTRGRAMHWIRVDRYFSIPGGKGPYDDEFGGREVTLAQRAERIQDSAKIAGHFMPVPCQQCEKAPCEVVCPVAATAHSADGLNDMAYNRCVGTRYCSNNCPYKVRRFNFYQYADYSTESLKLLNNPEVTVRTRGVMEKCTYCVQRIRNAEIVAEREFAVREKDANGRPKIFENELLTACQQACPTDAIVFGDINDLGDSESASAVARWKVEPHNYGLLAEQNTMPRTSYLAAIKNPNPSLLAATKGA